MGPSGPVLFSIKCSIIRRDVPHGFAAALDRECIREFLVERGYREQASFFESNTGPK
jgi:hypothetical protein